MLKWTTIGEGCWSEARSVYTGEDAIILCSWASLKDTRFRRMPVYYVVTELCMYVRMFHCVFNILCLYKEACGEAEENNLPLHMLHTLFDSILELMSYY